MTQDLPLIVPTVLDNELCITETLQIIVLSMTDIGGSDRPLEIFYNIEYSTTVYLTSSVPN